MPRSFSFKSDDSTRVPILRSASEAMLIMRPEPAMPPLTFAAASPFELLDLPDGRCYVARPADAAPTLVAGSFAPIEPPAAAGRNPVGVYGSRNEAELAVQRAAPQRMAALAPFAAWLSK